MRVKVGDTWYECEPNRPIMVELTQGDKMNIKEMAPHCNKYAIFDDSDETSTEEKYEWMSK